MAITNKEIKRNELYKLNNQLIKMYGVLKNLQNDMIVEINNCAICELEKAGLLKRKVVEHNMRSAVKRYTNMYMRIKLLEEDARELRNWLAGDE